MEVLHRLFFGVLPPPFIAAEMAALPAAMGWDRKPNRVDRLHMTLALTEDFPEMPPQVIDAFVEIGNTISAEPFRLVFDRAIASKSLLLLFPSEPLLPVEQFRQNLVEAIAAAGLPLRKGVQFNPHITLSYQKGEPFDQPIGSFIWLAEEFVLIHSHVGLTRHDVDGRWKLSADRRAQPQSDLFATR
jgi:RNA 2',3'-cyclic 3'-phosphodiesterase